MIEKGEPDQTQLSPRQIINCFAGNTFVTNSTTHLAATLVIVLFVISAHKVMLVIRIQIPRENKSRRCWHS